MRASAWSNGAPQPSGAGYGIRISTRDRDQHFDSSWENIDIDLGPSGHTTVTLSDSFWRTCTELRSADIGRWLITHHFAHWPRGHPPLLELHHLHDNRFRLTTRP